MGKKKSAQPSLPRRLLEGLDEADELLRRKRWNEARDELEELAHKFPGRPEVLGLLLNTYHELNDSLGYQSAAERLLKAGERDPALRLALAGVYMGNGLAALALKTVGDFLRRAPDHPKAADAREMAGVLEKAVAAMLAELGVAGDEGYRLAELHEEVQACLNQGQYARARQLAADFLRRHPNFAPVLNNLTQAYAVDGYLAEALATTERVLAFEPDNIHALSNRTRCLVLLGRLDEAWQVAQRLKESHALAVDGGLKKAEALSYLGDDAGVLAVFQQAERADKDEATLHRGMLWHLAAVAAMRLGREADAKRYWERASKIEPGLQFAKDNLGDLRRPVGERNAPWAYTLNYWLSHATARDLERMMTQAQSKGDEALKMAARRFLEKHPEINTLIPIWFERGGADARQFALMLVEAAATPELLAATQAFALSQRGSDELRMKAAQIATRHGVLPSGQVRFWAQGEWRDVLIMGIEIHGEPVRSYPHKPQVERWLYEAYQLMQAGDFVRAEPLLRQALAVEPAQPDLQYNLAAIFAATDRLEAAEAAWREIFERAPEYLFARASLARALALRGEVAQARELLDPLFTRQRMHFSEFAAFAGAQIDLLVADGKPDAARQWVEMWERVDAEDPKVDYYRRLVNKTARKPLFGGRA
jgi:tetratricopeptide (TPR) repeat protein